MLVFVAHFIGLNKSNERKGLNEENTKDQKYNNWLYSKDKEIAIFISQSKQKMQDLENSSVCTIPKTLNTF